GYGLITKDGLIETANKVTLKIKNVTLKQALDACFKNQPLTYEIVGKTIVVKEKPVQIIRPQNIPQYDKRLLKGKVTDTLGIPLIVVTIRIKDTPNSTNTDEKGEWSIEAPDGSVLVFSFIGFNTLEIPSDY